MIQHFDLTFSHTDEGNCRLYYLAKNKHNQKLLYCFMEVHTVEGFKLYRCSLDGEPDKIVVPTYECKIEIPKLKNPFKLERRFLEYLMVK